MKGTLGIYAAGLFITAALCWGTILAKQNTWPAHAVQILHGIAAACLVAGFLLSMLTILAVT